jgi:hypothetical protein
MVRDEGAWPVQWRVVEHAQRKTVYTPATMCTLGGQGELMSTHIADYVGYERAVQLAHCRVGFAQCETAVVWCPYHG